MQKLASYIHIVTKVRFPPPDSSRRSVAVYAPVLLCAECALVVLFPGIVEGTEEDDVAREGVAEGTYGCLLVRLARYGCPVALPLPRPSRLGDDRILAAARLLHKLSTIRPRVPRWRALARTRGHCGHWQCTRYESRRMPKTTDCGGQYLSTLQALSTTLARMRLGAVWCPVRPTRSRGSVPFGPTLR